MGNSVRDTNRFTLEIEYVDCPYCGENDSQKWAKENRYTAVKCTNCEFVYVNPRPLLKSINEASRLGYHETDRGQIDVVRRFRKKKVNKFKDRLLELYSDHELVGKKVNWLDIGTGFGEFLLTLKEITSSHSTIAGIEPCKPKLEVANGLGLNVTNRSLNEISEKYNYISLINVFSHVPTPKEFISALKSILLPEGEILLVTGNTADIPRSDYPAPLNLPDHLVFAGEAHIKGLLENVGFDVLRIMKYRQSLPQNRIVYWCKRLGKSLLYGKHVPLLTKGTFRSLWVRARLA